MTQYDQLIDRLIDLAIEEDIATGDVTTNSIIPAHSRAVAEMKMKVPCDWEKIPAFSFVPGL